MSRRVLWWSLVAVLLALEAAAWFFGVYWRGVQEQQQRFDPIIQSVAAKYGMDPFLIKAVVWRESVFNPRVVGPAGERGLMQVMPTTGRDWAKANKISDYKDDDLFDPRTNLMAGTWYLARAMKHWSGCDDPASFALAEYNAGRTNALRWVDPNQPQNFQAFLNRIDFPSTYKYIKVIEGKRREYQRKAAGKWWPPWS